MLKMKSAREGLGCKRGGGVKKRGREATGQRWREGDSRLKAGNEGLKTGPRGPRDKGQG